MRIDSAFTAWLHFNNGWFLTHIYGDYKCIDNQIVSPENSHGLTNLIYLYIKQKVKREQEASSISNTLPVAPAVTSLDCYRIMYRSRKHQEHLYYLSTYCFLDQRGILWFHKRHKLSSTFLPWWMCLYVPIAVAPCAWVTLWMCVIASDYSGSSMCCCVTQWSN